MCQNIPAIMTGLSGSALVVRTAVRRVRGTTPGRYDGVPRAPERAEREPRTEQAVTPSALMDARARHPA
ncbi:MAG: hypothetical protein FJW92_07520 [Actinobacteria bacterium]|nr:hypothetical protein [Actinomycetota bacterium]